MPPSKLPFRVDFTSASASSNNLYAYVSSERDVTHSTTTSAVSTKPGVISSTSTENSENHNENTVILFSKNTLLSIVLTNVVIIVIFCSMFLFCFCCRRKSNVQNTSPDFRENMSFCSRKIINYPSKTQHRSKQNSQDSPDPETTGRFRFNTENKSPTDDTNFVTLTHEKRYEIHMYENDYDICQEQPHGNETELYLTAV